MLTYYLREALFKVQVIGSKARSIDIDRGPVHRGGALCAL